MHTIDIVIAYAFGVMTGGTIGTFFMALLCGRQDDEEDDDE